MDIIIITPPVVQLNSPYPSGAYLKSFFNLSGHTARWYDLNIDLFHSLFSSEGLTKLFALSSENALKLASKAENSGDDFTAFNLRRYVSQKDRWIYWIDYITGILCSAKDGFSGRELAHQFLFSPFAPRGSRMENFLAGLSHEPSVDDVRLLCSLALADIADYITFAFDPAFSLVRYAESLTVDESSFSEIEKKISSPVMEHFYKPVLDAFSENALKTLENTEKASCLVCISIPFAGTFIPALYTASYLKQKYGSRILISIGGGFVNTELRDASEPALSRYTDMISYDRGYGSYLMLDKKAFSNGDFHPSEKIYKMRFFYKDRVIEPLWQDDDAEKLEKQMTVKVVPDYSDIDFSRYPRVCDAENPMHRLWSDGAWIKAYLAHGCYWHKCSFCDVNLDYVSGYCPGDVELLFNNLKECSRKKGVYGIHFVDEALPPALLYRFALLNARNNGHLYFWGNIRFEKTFSRDFADFLSYCGFGGVSAGLEAATGKGLENICKGTQIDGIVQACAAFKEAGILVHAYMIYGFWNDTAQDIIDSMETLRQFFKSCLLDSAFWHKFILTKNSRVFGEWKKGLHPELHPVLNDDGSMFAKNNLHFKGEKSYSKFGPGLDAALDSWMHGHNLEKKVQNWFDFPVPSPKVAKDFIDRQIQLYEKRKNRENNADLNPSKLFWLGSSVIFMEKNPSVLSWFYLQEEFMLELKDFPRCRISAKTITALLEKLRPECSEEVHHDAEKQISDNDEIKILLKQFRGKGLVQL